jgi:hypothetical protein
MESDIGIFRRGPVPPPARLIGFNHPLGSILQQPLQLFLPVLMRAPPVLASILFCTARVVLALLRSAELVDHVSRVE